MASDKLLPLLREEDRGDKIIMNIKIKSHYGKWHEVNKEEARKFLKTVFRPWDKEVFKKHFKGVTYEKLRTDN